MVLMLNVMEMILLKDYEVLNVNGLVVVDCLWN